MSMIRGLRNHRYKVKFPYKEYKIDDFLGARTKNPEFHRTMFKTEHRNRIAAQQTRLDQVEIELPYDAALPDMYVTAFPSSPNNSSISHILAGGPIRPPKHLNGWDFIPQADPSWHPNGAYKAVRHLGGTRTPVDALESPHARARDGVAPVTKWHLPPFMPFTYRGWHRWSGDHLLAITDDAPRTGGVVAPPPRVRGRW